MTYPLNTTRPPLSPELAAILNEHAAQEQNRKLWCQTLAAHLENAYDYRPDLRRIEIEAHSDHLITVSASGRAAVILRHTHPTFQVTGRASITFDDARRYIRSNGWAPLGADASAVKLPDLRSALHPITTPWAALHTTAQPLGMDGDNLTLPSRVAKRLKARKQRFAIKASGALDPVEVTATFSTEHGTINALFILMPLRLDPS